MNAGVEYPQITVVNQSSATYTTDGNSGSLDVSGFHFITVGIDVTSLAGGGNLNFNLEFLGPDGNWYQGEITKTFTVPNTGLQLQTIEHVPTTTARIRWSGFLSGITSATFLYWITGQA